MRSLFLLPVLAFSLAAQEPVDAALNARLREEGLSRSQAFKTLETLCDSFGPRLMVSPSYRAAADWALGRMKEWGLSNPRLEPFDFGHPGWTNEFCAVHAVAPFRDPLGVEVVAWTPSTKGSVTGAAWRLELPEEPTAEELETFLAAHLKDARGKVVFVGTPKPLPVVPEGAPRYREDEAILAKRFDPAQPPSAPQRPSGMERPKPRRVGALDPKELDQRVNAFLVKAGALARVNDAAMRNGLIRAFNNRTYDLTKAVPTVVMRREEYGRLWRLLDRCEAVRLSLDIRNRVHPEHTKGLNLVAELPGREKPEEVVILSAHFDSWHTATGATDDAGSCAVMMEALRLLKTAGVPPRRTIRMVLFDGEEQGLLGSEAYVKAHYGSFENPKADFKNLVACINMDAGAGQMRGLGAFGPPASAQVLRELLAPFKDLGAVGAMNRTSRPARAGGSDSGTFSHAGLPVMGPTQDGLEYFTTTWHTQVDTPERVSPQDLARTATMLASVAYHLAERPEMLPRFTEKDMPALPKPAGSTAP